MGFIFPVVSSEMFEEEKTQEMTKEIQREEVERDREKERREKREQREREKREREKKILLLSIQYKLITSPKSIQSELCKALLN